MYDRQQWRAWWIEYGLESEVGKDVKWDKIPSDFDVDDAQYQVDGKTILNETIKEFRNDQCYVGANALKVIWRARSALRERGLFNARIIRYAANDLSVFTS